MMVYRIFLSQKPTLLLEKLIISEYLQFNKYCRIFQH